MTLTLKRQQTHREVLDCAPKLLTNTMKDNKISHLVWSKRHFDPNRKEDLLQYKHFLDNSKWPQNCPFILEWPYLTMQEMIRSKLIETYFDKILESVDEQS